MAPKPGLNPEKTYAAVLTAARNRRFVTYGELAAASDIPWNQAWRQIGRHLDSFTLLTSQRGCPLLSSIVVTKRNKESGAIEDRQLDGLLAAAELAGLSVTDPQTFVRQEQERVFAWAVTAPDGLEPSARP